MLNKTFGKNIVQPLDVMKFIPIFNEQTSQNSEFIPAPSANLVRFGDVSQL